MSSSRMRARTRTPSRDRSPLPWRARGYSTWFDDYELVVGSRLAGSIDRGLSTSRYGVVIVSPAFIRKQWTQRELSGLVGRETGEGKELILPVWHGVTASQVRAFSPPLADVVAINSAAGLDEVVNAIALSIERRRSQEADVGRALVAAEVRSNPVSNSSEASQARSEHPGPEWRPKTEAEAALLAKPTGPLVARMRNVGTAAVLESSELKTTIGGFAGVLDVPDGRVPPDSDVALRFGAGELGAMVLQAAEPILLTLRFRAEASDDLWELRIELLRNGSAVDGRPRWRRGEQRVRRHGGL